jgi:hypothetical protein
MRFCGLLALGLYLTGCVSNRAVVTAGDACSVFREILYRDGQLKFTPDETSHLTDVNLTKLLAAKKFYQKACSK